MSKTLNKKQRRKGHNPNKRAQRFFSNTRLWSWESMVDESGMRISHGEARCGFAWKQLSQKEVDGLIVRNNNWVVCCRALCEVNGKEWIESEIRSARDIKINDLAFIYDELRESVLSSVQRCHVVDVGWIVHSFNKHDRIDDNFELAYPEYVTDERRAKWAKLNETYHDRRQQEVKAA